MKTTKSAPSTGGKRHWALVKGAMKEAQEAANEQPSSSLKSTSTNSTKSNSKSAPPTKENPFQEVANTPFGNSKFFLKKQNIAAKKIQKYARRFLAQARVFHMLKLAPLQAELASCAHRKVEELQRIGEHLKQELEHGPQSVAEEFRQLELRASGAQEDIGPLKQAIALLEQANAKYKTDIKELKKSNKELKASAAQHADSEFSIEVQKTKARKEIEYLEEEFEKLKYKVEAAKEANQKADAKIFKVSGQKKTYQATIKKILTLMEDNKIKDSGSTPPPSKSSSKRHSSRSNLNLEDDSEVSLTMSPTKPKSIKKMSKKPGEQAVFDWGSQSINWSNNDAAETFGASFNWHQHMEESFSALENTADASSAKPNRFDLMTAAGGGGGMKKQTSSRQLGRTSTTPTRVSGRPGMMKKAQSSRRLGSTTGMSSDTHVSGKKKKSSVQRPGCPPKLLKLLKDIKKTNLKKIKQLEKKP